MRAGQIILALICISAIVNVKAQPSPDWIKNAVDKKLNDYINNPKMQLKFIQEFIKGVIIGEIRLYDLAINQSNKLGKEKVSKIKEEMNGLIGLLFAGKYKNLQELVSDLKKQDGSQLKDIFSEQSFNVDLQQFNYQETLANEIIKALFTSTNQNENLTRSFQYLDLIEKFIVDFKGASQTEVHKTLSYLKDATLVKSSLQSLGNQLNNPKAISSLFKLLSKYKDMNEGNDIIQMIQDDPALLKMLADSNLNDLQKVKEQITSIGGQAYEDYYKNNQNKSGNNNNVDSQDEDEDEDDEDEDSKNKSSTGKIILITFGIIAFIGIGYFLIRKYRQNKFNDGSYSENKKLYKQTSDQA